MLALLLAGGLPLLPGDAPTFVVATFLLDIGLLAFVGTRETLGGVDGGFLRGPRETASV